jgi:peptidyl-tRNA hydrolase, PTH1 family
VVDRLAATCGIKLRRPQLLARYDSGRGSWQGREIVLVKPLTFMNASGEIVRSVFRHSRASITDLIIVCDNLDLETGTIKMKLSGSSGGHRGLESIFAALKTTAVARLSIGIGHPGRRGRVIAHVLGDPDGDEVMILEAAVVAAEKAVLRLLKEPSSRVMADVNRRKKPDAPAQG